MKHKIVVILATISLISFAFTLGGCAGTIHRNNMSSHSQAKNEQVHSILETSNRSADDYHIDDTAILYGIGTGVVIGVVAFTGLMALILLTSPSQLVIL